MKKGISALSTILIAMVMMIVVFLIFSSFAGGGLRQIAPVFSKASEAAGEIPCSTAPTVSIDEVTHVWPVDKSGNLKYGNVKTIFNAAIGSNCFENLSISWTFTETDGKTVTVDTECAAPYNRDNCSTTNHTFAVSSALDLWKALPVNIYVFGTRSGFSTSTATTAFIDDPTFEFTSVSAPNAAEFSCVNIGFALTSTATGGRITDPAANGVALDVVDNLKTKDVEKIASSAAYYRADQRLGVPHEVYLKATARGYQTIASEKITYSPPADFTPKSEVISFGSDTFSVDDIKQPSATLLNGLLPNNFKDGKDVAVGNIGGQYANGIAFLFGQSFFAMPYDMLRSTQYALSGITSDRLKQLWPYHELDGGIGWNSIAIGKKIAAPEDKGDGNIVVLGNPGDLDLYQYSYGKITQLERGSSFVDFNNWRDVTVADLDSDGEDEIVGLTSGGICVFKYKDYKSVENKVPYCTDTNFNNWNAIAGGDFSGNSNQMQFVLLGNTGDVKVLYYDLSKKSVSINNLQGAKGAYIDQWPDDVTWLDVTAVHDGATDKLAFLFRGTYAGESRNKLLITTLSDLTSCTNSYDNTMASVLNCLNPKGNTRELDLGVASLYQLNSVAGGDIACS